MDTGIVPGEIGILLEYREVTGTPGGYWAYMGHREEGRQPTRDSCAPSL